MTRVVHGGVTAAELAWAASAGVELVDLSASLNPYGPHPAVIEAARSAVFHRYPEADAGQIRAAYAERHGFAPDTVLAGNGSTELLYLFARAFPGPSLIVGPTFGEYRAASLAAGLEVHEVTPRVRCLELNADDVIAAVRRIRPGIVFVCNPNNPTGQLWPRAAIREIAAAAADGLVLVDEAYMDFAHPADESVRAAGNVLVLRSMTKLHAIPGLRIGFLVGEPGAIARVQAHQPAWPVSAPATAATLECLRQAAWERTCRQRVAATRDVLRTQLAGAGLRVGPSTANFLLVDVQAAAAFRQRLLKRGWVVRDCSSFGLAGHVRVAVPREDQAERLLRDFKGCLE